MIRSSEAGVQMSDENLSGPLVSSSPSLLMDSSLMDLLFPGFKRWILWFEIISVKVKFYIKHLVQS